MHTHFKPFVRALKQRIPTMNDFVINVPTNTEQVATLAFSFGIENTATIRNETYKTRDSLKPLLADVGLSETQSLHVLKVIEMCANIDALSCSVIVTLQVTNESVKIVCNNMASSISAAWCKKLEDTVPLDDVIIDVKQRTWEFVLSRRDQVKYRKLFS